MTGRGLTDEQRAEALRMWANEKSLGEIAARLGCSIYDLSPWLLRAQPDEARA